MCLPDKGMGARLLLHEEDVLFIPAVIGILIVGVGDGA